MSQVQYKVSEDVVSRTNQDGTVIVMKMDEGNSFFKIDGIAAEVWRDLAQDKTLPTIISSIAQDYDAPVEKIQSDVSSLMEKLLAKNLIKKI